MKPSEGSVCSRTEFLIYNSVIHLASCFVQTQQISGVSLRAVQVNIEQVDKMMNDTLKPVRSLVFWFARQPHVGSTARYSHRHQNLEFLCR
jgi:hypothetical protein